MNGLGLVLWVVLGGAPAPWRLTAAYRDLRVRLVQADGGCASYATNSMRTRIASRPRVASSGSRNS